MSKRQQHPAKYWIQSDDHRGRRIWISRARCYGWFETLMPILIFWGGPEFVCTCILFDKSGGHPAAAQYPLPALVTFLAVWTLLGIWLLWRFWRFCRLEDVLTIQRDMLILANVDLFRDRVARCPLARIRNLRYSGLWEVPVPRVLDRQPQLAIIHFDCRGNQHSFGRNLSDSDCREVINLLTRDYEIQRAEPDYETDQDARDLVWALERGLSYRD